MILTEDTMEIAGEELSEEPFPEAQPEDPELERQLDELQRRWGVDPLSRLHRLPLYDLESEDLLPDDVTEAYAQGLADRAAFLEQVRGLGGLALRTPLRTPDVETALDEMVAGPGRVVVIRCTPAEALLHLQFCAGRSPAEHALTWARWHREYGAEPVVLANRQLQGFASRPPNTRAALVALTIELAAYCPEACSEGWLPLAAQLYKNTTFGAWWD